jgi:hypothetical protein
MFRRAVGAVLWTRSRSELTTPAPLTGQDLDSRQGQALPKICEWVAVLALAAPGAERDTARAMSEENIEAFKRFVDAFNRAGLHMRSMAFRFWMTSPTVR